MKKIYLLSILFASSGLANAQTFWCKVPYMGAFGNAANADWTKGWSNFDPNKAVYPSTDSTISAGDISANRTLSSAKTYLLDGFIYIKNNATLTIPAGTVLRGKKGSKATIIVTRGSKIIANGTVNNPIVFTSDQAVDSRDFGDWGGIIMLGKAPVNPSGGVATIEGGVNNANNDGAYGGSDTLDNSGSLKYVRLEFGGAAFQPNNEINGLTMGGVGRGTTLEFIQVSYSGDDAFEWFGGNVDAKWLISHRNWDDDFDTDFGYAGRVQFGIIIRDPKIADISGSNGFESDNDGTGSDNAPYTRCVFSNITAVGAGGNANLNYAPSFNANHKRGMHIRRNSRHSLVNSIIIGYTTGLLMDSKKTYDRIADSTATISNNYFVYCKKVFDTAGTRASYPSLDIAGWATATKNMKIDSLAGIKLGSYSLTAPNLLPQAGSPALTGANFGFAKVKNNTVCEWGLNVEPVFASNASIGAFPNPSQGTIQITAEILKPVSATLQVIDLTGKTVYSSSLKLSAGKFNENLNLSGVNNGFYLIRLVAGAQSISTKVSINK